MMSHPPRPVWAPQYQRAKETLDQAQQRAWPRLGQHWNRLPRDWGFSILGDAQIPAGYSPGQPALAAPALIRGGLEVPGGLYQLQPFFNTLQRYFTQGKPKCAVGEGGKSFHFDEFVFLNEKCCQRTSKPRHSRIA